jgi:hypothetical protein
LFFFIPLLLVFRQTDLDFQTGRRKLYQSTYLIVGLVYKGLMILFQLLYIYVLTIVNYFKTKRNDSTFMNSEFERMMSGDKSLREEFVKFAMKEFSIENIMCFDDILLFESMESEEERKSKALEIKELYLTSSSVREVNIGNFKALVASINEGVVPVDLFSNVTQILKCNMVDTYSRFIVDPEYENLNEKKSLLENLVYVENKF